MTRYWDGRLIRLRGVEPGDAEAHFWLNQDEEIFRNLAQIYPPQSLAAVRVWAEREATRKFEDDTYSFQMETLEGGELVGGIATHDCDRRVGVFSYGLHVLPRHRRQGYAAEAICLVLRYYFGELRYQKANAGVYAINEASARLHEHLGFTLEGRQRRVVYTHGEHSDLLLFGITAEEFAARHPDYWR